MELNKHEMQLLLSILEVYIPVAAPLVSEDELDDTQELKDKIQAELDQHAQEELNGLDN